MRPTRLWSMSRLLRHREVEGPVDAASRVEVPVVATSSVEGPVGVAARVEVPVVTA